MTYVPTGEPARTGAPERASFALWGIDWSTWLPQLLGRDGISLRLGTIESAVPFIAEHYARIFEQDDRDDFVVEHFDGAKLRYLQSSDVFEVVDGCRTIGLVIAGPSDWSTYYIRSVAMLPDYQGRQLEYSIFPPMFARLAAAGVRRVEAETSPSNLVTVHVLSRMRFNITGTVVSERWGALIRLTKFLDEKSEDVFLGKFCRGIRYQRRGGLGARAARERRTQ